MENFILENNNKFIWFDNRDVIGFLKENPCNLLPSISISCLPICNMSCPHCIYDISNSNKESISLKKKLFILAEAHKLGAEYLQICHDGEPLLDDSTLSLIDKATSYNMKTFMYTNASLVDKKTAGYLFENNVCLGIHFDSLNHNVFNEMLGNNKGAKQIFKGVENLLNAGYNKPFERKGKFYTKLGLVTTLTSLNTKNFGDLKKVAKFAWENNIFFGIARLEKGGRTVGAVWDKMKVQKKDSVVEFVNWCSEQTGVDYWYAQPEPYCIGVCGLHVSSSGDVWASEYGGSCDFTEPDGESYPEKLITFGNVKKEELENILEKIWKYRKEVYNTGALDKKLLEYEKTKDIYPNGLQDCGSARTYTLFQPYYEYVKYNVENNKDI